METQRIIELAGTAIAVLGLGAGNIMQRGEVSSQQESIERWELQVNQCLERSDKREIRLRDECLAWIDKLYPKAVNASYSVVNTCPTWPCEHNDQCLGCFCIQGFCTSEGESYGNVACEP